MSQVNLAATIRAVAGLFNFQRPGPVTIVTVSTSTTAVTVAKQPK